MRPQGPDPRALALARAHDLIREGQGDAALALLQPLLGVAPDDAELNRAAAGAHRAARRLGPAVEAIERALKGRPGDIGIWLQREILAEEAGGPPAQLEVLDRALAAAPNDPRLLNRRILALGRAGRASEAIADARAAAEAHPQAAWPAAALGRFLTPTDPATAARHLREAVRLDPADPGHRVALAYALQAVTGADEAAALDEAAGLVLEALPNLPPTASAVAMSILWRVGEFEAAERLGTFERLGRYWAQNGAHAALLYQFPRVRSDADRHELMVQHRLWGERLEAVAPPPPARRPRGRRTRLRLGILSSDLRRHPVGQFARPLFDHLDPDVDLLCYSFHPGPGDEAEAWFAGGAAGFKRWPGASERQAAEAIAADGLDVLLELGGTTQFNRAGLLAHRPAPKQVSWLGYPHSLGLAAIDHIVLDRHLVPPDPGLLVETPLLMPQSWICMAPGAFLDEPAVDPVPPARRKGAVTFGTANNPYKFNAQVIRAWAEVVAATPGSRFMIVRPEAAGARFQAAFTRRFTEAGVAPERLVFRPVRGGHLALYNGIDVALDTFPQTGGTTTCEALWMGAPTVSLRGPALFERLSSSLLANAGLADLIADNPADYVSKAVALAGDLDRLADLRQGLRGRIRSGALGQAPRFAGDFYALMRRAAG